MTTTNSFDKLQSALKLLREGNPQAALIELNDNLEGMSAGDPCFNPMIWAAGQIQAGGVHAAKAVLEEAYERLSKETINNG